MDLIGTPPAQRLTIYTWLAKGRPRSYGGKILLVAFLGTHIPLLTLFVYAIVITDLSTAAKTHVLLVALVATLAGTGLTLFLLHQLLAPITLTYLSLRHYLTQRTKPQLPTYFTDEVGMLMADTMQVLDKLDTKIDQLTHYDPLTALPNRTLFQSKVDQQLQVARAQQSPLALMLLDIDNFATLNNHLGQANGDLVLQEAAQRLAAVAPEGHLLARLGGDEFALLTTGYPSLQSLITQSAKLLTAFQQPFAVADQTHYLSATMGIATCEQCGETASGLLTNADTALRLAKTKQRSGVQFYASSMNEALQRRLHLEREMRRALETESFTLYYQPQVDFESGEITGAEALLRWFHPKLGPISPLETIAVAEASGLILPLGEWVLGEACRQNVAWQRAGFAPLRVAVNLSAAQFQQTDLIEMVTKTLQVAQLAPDQLELEITESLLMADVERATATLHAFCHLGTSIALDDFGTGYSSLSYLKRFPLHYLKIDRSFVLGIPGDSDGAAIVEAVVALARTLRLAVIAEGVETEQQASYLQAIGCSTFQGYYFSRPVSGGDFVGLLQKAAQGTYNWRRSVEIGPTIVRARPADRYLATPTSIPVLPVIP